MAAMCTGIDGSCVQYDASRTKQGVACITPLCCDVGTMQHTRSFDLLMQHHDACGAALACTCISTCASRSHCTVQAVANSEVVVGGW
jgi:hypothetical protein